MCKNLTSVSYIVLELQVTKVEKLDVCNWRVFANPVTFMNVKNAGHTMPVTQKQELGIKLLSIISESSVLLLL